MSAYWRGIKNKNNWNRLNSGKEGEFGARALVDVSDTNLSVYEAPTDADIERIAIAFAAAKDHLDHLQYVWFDSSYIKIIGIEAIDEPGTTPDSWVNDQHRTFNNLTILQAYKLANVISSYIQNMKILTKPVVRTKIREYRDMGFIDESKLHPKVLSGIQ